jgi:hypothetical protein
MASPRAGSVVLVVVVVLATSSQTLAQFPRKPQQSAPASQKAQSPNEVAGERLIAVALLGLGGFLVFCYVQFQREKESQQRRAQEQAAEAAKKKKEEERKEAEYLAWAQNSATARRFRDGGIPANEMRGIFDWFQTDDGRAWQSTEPARRRKRCDEEVLTAHEDWKRHHESATLAEIDTMSGTQFEEFLHRLFSRMGYTEITVTGASGDQGADLRCRGPNGVWIVIQAKRWQGKVGNDAVMQLLGAMRFYDARLGMVVTNSAFTDKARELAKKGNDITLCDRDWLARRIKEHLPPEVPTFRWSEYYRVVKAAVRRVDKHWSANRFRQGLESWLTDWEQLRHAADAKQERLAWEQECERSQRVRQEQERAKREAEEKERAKREADEKEAARRRLEAAERARVDQANRDRAERLERWKRSGRPRVWVLDHVDGWEPPAFAALISDLRASLYWPMEPLAIEAYLNGLRAEIVAEEEKKHAEERQRRERERNERLLERAQRDAEREVERRRRQAAAEQAAREEKKKRAEFERQNIDVADRRNGPTAPRSPKPRTITGLEFVADLDFDTFQRECENCGAPWADDAHDNDSAICGRCDHCGYQSEDASPWQETAIRMWEDAEQ